MRIILASTSPRRAQLLRMLGLKFEIIPSDYEEVHDETRSVRVVVEELGKGKAAAVADIYPDAIVIGGDTIVAFEGKQIGKPVDEDDARRTLTAYSGKNSQVLSSAAVICRSKQYDFVGSGVATVQFADIPAETVERYLSTGNYTDKGGSFAIQHPIIQEVVASIDGSIDNIIGLPIETLRTALLELGIETTPLTPSQLLTMYK